MFFGSLYTLRKSKHSFSFTSDPASPQTILCHSTQHPTRIATANTRTRYLISTRLHVPVPASPGVPIGLPTKFRTTYRILYTCRLEHQLGTWGRKARKCSPAWSTRLVNGRIVQFHSSKSTFSTTRSKDFLTANAASRRRPSLSSSCDSVGGFAVREEEGDNDKMSSQPLLATAPGRWILAFRCIHISSSRHMHTY